METLFCLNLYHWPSALLMILQWPSETSSCLTSSLAQNVIFVYTLFSLLVIESPMYRRSPTFPCMWDSHAHKIKFDFFFQYISCQFDYSMSQKEKEKKERKKEKERKEKTGWKGDFSLCPQSSEGKLVGWYQKLSQRIAVVALRKLRQVGPNLA